MTTTVWVLIAVILLLLPIIFLLYLIWKAIRREMIGHQ